MRVLLVEPEYKNKYPPLGLMKISAYHKKRKDEVVFVKGEVNELKYEVWDRIYVTTLFTFYFDLTIHTIRYYKNYVKNTSDIYVGGILASLMPARIKEESGIDNVITGVLSNSSLLGYNDNIIIDDLTPDYSILDKISYKYPATDCYIAYTTRGCPNKCSFCAVPRLEPNFKISGNIEKHIKQADRMYGSRKNLLLLDNNILNSPNLEKLVESLNRLGFSKKATYFKKYPIDYFIDDYKEKKSFKRQYLYVKKNLEELIAENITNISSELSTFYARLNRSTDPIRYLYRNALEIKKILGIVETTKPSMRYIDFNQGLDAALLSNEKLEILSRLPIKPLRIAFDSINDKEDYINAVRLAKKHGIKSISNYLLYNYTDNPNDLWERININTELREELGLNIFSFPMKYSPINLTDRKYIGKYWNKKYLRAINGILLVKKGIVSSNKSFVERAFGKTLEEYNRILTMPQDFIIYRTYFENNGMSTIWREQYDSLNKNEREELVSILSNSNYLTGNKKIKKILELYEVSYAEEIEKN